MRADHGKSALNARHGTWLSMCIAVTLVPHVEYLPPWLIALCALLLCWRVATDRGLTPLPMRPLLLLAAIAITIGTAVEYRQLMGKDPGLALLAGLACLKLLESRTVRDGRALVMLSFFLQMGQFLNGQEIAVALITLCGCVLAVASLMTLENDAGARFVLRKSGLLLLQAMPFMVVLFVLFPRIQGPLWGLPADAFSGLTGLSESMAPGSISNLIRSGKIAFRAEFAGPPPPPGLRYWRGPILSHFDGRTWRPGFATLSRTPPYALAGPSYDYRLTLEAHNQQWMLALDYPGNPPPRTRISTDLQLLSVAPVRTRQRYQLSAYPSARVGAVERLHVLRRNLRLPAGSNPRLQAMGRQILDDQEDPGARVDALVAAFRARDLEYTLSPSRLGQHAGDEFFFDTGQGFCEHFSSAFTIAARAAGIPARVVTGYQGGELNPLDGSLVIRQSDAHAWVEVWLATRGWLRIDPTAASNPRRIDSGIAGALPDADLLPLFIQPQLSWLRDFRYRWEALTNTWNQWVLGYNDERQQIFLRELGFDTADWKELGAALAGVIGSLMLAYLAWALLRVDRGDALDRVWQRFCKRMARAGTARYPWQGPTEFAEEAAGRHPGQAGAIRRIAASYARLRYGPRKASATEIRALRQQVNHFSLR